MASEKLVHLYTNSLIRLCESFEGLVVRERDLTVVRDAGARPSPNSFKFLRNVFIDQENRFLELRAVSMDDQEITFHVTPPMSFILEELRNAFQDPFIKILLKMIDPDLRFSETVVYEWRLELADEFYDTEGAEFFATVPLDKMTSGSYFGLSISLGWTEDYEAPSHVNPIKIRTTSFMRSLYQRDSSKDLRLVAGNGGEIKCHKIIFEAHSDVLAAIISAENGMVESQTGRIEMEENSEEGLSYLVRYLYGLELPKDDLSCDVVVELFKTAHKYQLTHLQDCLADLLRRAEADWFTADDLVELYFYVKNLHDMCDLRDQLLIISSTCEELPTCERFKELEQTDAKAAKDFLQKLDDLKPEELFPEDSDAGVLLKAIAQRLKEFKQNRLLENSGQEPENGPLLKLL